MPSSKITIATLQDLPHVVATFLKIIKNKKVIAFYGEMGVGKTTFIKELCHQLGVIGNINSPTFSIVNEYETESKNIIYHFDFYRIKDENEVMDLGYEDYFYSNNYCFIEWPEKIDNLLTQNIVKVSIVQNNKNKRVITIEDTM